MFYSQVALAHMSASGIILYPSNAQSRVRSSQLLSFAAIRRQGPRFKSRMDGWMECTVEPVPCTPSACSRLFSFLWRTTNESLVISPVTSSVSHCRWFFSLSIPTRSILCASTAIAGPTLSSTSDYTHRVYERHLSSSYYIDEH